MKSMRSKMKEMRNEGREFPRGSGWRRKKMRVCEREESV